MKPQHNFHAIKFPATPPRMPLNTFASLFDVNMNVRELKHGIVLNIKIDANQLTELFRSIAEKSFTEDSHLSDHNNEIPVEELAVEKEDLTPVLWINDNNYLTSREVEIMERLSKGRNYKEIADDLGITYNTVRNHLQHIYPKLGVGNRSEASIEYMIIRNKHKKLSSAG